jgi:hypothetical protein
MSTNSNCLLVRDMSEGKINQLIKQKRIFLRQALKDYSAGGNDMLDDVEALLQEAKAEITHNLELASCLREEEGEAAWQKECLSMFNAWYEKWFGMP